MLIFVTFTQTTKIARCHIRFNFRSKLQFLAAIFSAAADQLKGKIVLAGMDLTRPGNEVVARQFGIEGYPTLEYFEDGVHKFRYRAEYSKVGILFRSIEA